MIATRLEVEVNEPESFESFSYIPRRRTQGAPGREGKIFIEISIPEDMDMLSATEEVRQALRGAGVKEL